MRRSFKGLIVGLLALMACLFGVIGCDTIDMPDNGVGSKPDPNRLAAVEQSSIRASLNGTQLTVEWGAVYSAEKYVVMFGAAQYVCNAPATRAVFNNVEYVSGTLTVTIVARAAGFEDSAVTTYTFTPGETQPPPEPGTLATPTGLAVNNGTLSWIKVTNATSYTVTDGTKIVSVSTNSIVLGTNGFTVPTSGSVTYSVVAKAEGYNDSAAAIFTYTPSGPPQPQTLATPTGLVVAVSTLTWTPVPNATSYTVSDGATTKTVNTNSIDLAANGFTIPESGSVTYSVVAKAAGYNDSASASYTHTYSHTHTFNEDYWASNQTHHWNPVTCGHAVAAENSKNYGAHEFDGGNTCSVCAYTRSSPVTVKYVTFGEYPQTLKDASVTVGGAADANGYYTGSDNAKYAKVTAAPGERFPGDPIVFNNSERIVTGTEYYFKVEPIKWRVLEEKDGSSLILCESIIDGGMYYRDENSRTIGGSTVYPSNYMYSDIRDWLNGTFYSAAFSASQQQNIQTTTVDNSAATTGYSENTYVCDDTQDKVFLLSNRDLYNTEYGFISDGTEADPARLLIVSDYARAVGVYARNEVAYRGGGSWWLRSPMWDSAIDADCGSASGMISSSKVNRMGGIAPAMRVTSSALTALAAL